MLQVLLDMDGVLVDFVSGALKLHGVGGSIEEVYANNLGSWSLPEILDIDSSDFFSPMEYAFWANLDWMPDGGSILKMVEDRFGQKNITLWTSPTHNKGCRAGKLSWVERHLPKYYRNNIIIHGKKWLAANPTNLLIDDADSNHTAFLQKQGKSVLVSRIWNSAYSLRHQTLEKLGRDLDEYP